MGIMQQMAGALQTFVNTGGTQPQPTAQPSAAPVSVSPWGLTGEEYVQGRHLETFNAVIQSQAESLANLALEQVRRENETYFLKYGPEINATVARIPSQQRTLDNLRTAVKFVLAGHVDELSREGAAKLTAEMGGTGIGRSHGGASPLPGSAPEADRSLKSEKLPPEWRERAARAGVTEAALDEFVRANEGMTRDDFFRLFENRTIISEGVKSG